MSRTTTFTVGNRGFWALDDAFGVWLADVIEESTRHEIEPWQAKLAEAWRLAARSPIMVRTQAT